MSALYTKIDQAEQSLSLYHIYMIFGDGCLYSLKYTSGYYLSSISPSVDSNKTVFIPSLPCALILASY